LLAVFFAFTGEERERINQLILLIATGDRNALEEFYKSIGGRLFSVALGLMRNRQNAEDVLHDSLIRIVRYAKTFNKGTNGYAWACKIVKNTALNKIKSEGYRQGQNIDCFFHLSSGGDLYEERGRALDIKSAMQNLSSAERLVIWLKYYNDMTVREISQQTNMKKSTVQDNIKRAEEKLKLLLK